MGIVMVLALLVPLTASGQSPEEARKELLKRGIPFDTGPFIVHAELGDTPAVESFLTARMNPNMKAMYGRTTLMYAAWNGHTATVQLLLGRGTDVSVKDEEGSTALMLAAMEDHTNIIVLLKKAWAKE